MSNMFRDSQQLKLSAVGAAVALLTVGFSGCGGGGDNTVTSVGGVTVTTVGPVTTTTVPTSTAVYVTGAGNSPFVGVQMTATCANGATGSATIGTPPAAPGEGTITVANCVFPVRIEATGTGKMRPIGASADGLGDVAYDPAVNLPISNVYATPPAPGASVTLTANPVTTLVANAVAATSAALATLSPASIAAAASQVASALGLPASEVTNSQSYLLPGIAEASARLAEVTALAVQTAATAASSPASSAKPLGRQCAEAFAQASNLTTASAAAAALKKSSVADVASDAAITSNSIDNDAGYVKNIVKTVVISKASARIADLSISSANSGDAQLMPYVNAHNAEITTRAAATKMVTDVRAALASVPPTSAAEAATKIAVAKAAADKMVADTETKLTAYNAGTGTVKPADLAIQNKAVATQVAGAIQTFAPPPVPGASSSYAANLAAVLVNTAPTASTANANDVAAYQGAIAAVAGQIPSALGTDSMKNLTGAVNQVISKIKDALPTPPSPGSSPNAGTGSVDDLQQRVEKAKAEAKRALGTVTDNFATPPAVGSVPSITWATTTTTTAAKVTSTTVGSSTTTTAFSAPPTPGVTPTTTTVGNVTTTSLPTPYISGSIAVVSSTDPNPPVSTTWIVTSTTATTVGNVTTTTAFPTPPAVGGK